MAAVLLMACDPNGRVDVPGNDKKALNQSASKALSLIGEDAQLMDSELMKLGFTKTIPVEDVNAGEPKLDGAVYYLLNVPSKFLVVKEDEERDVINEIVGSKHAGIAIAAIYEDNKLELIRGKVFVGADVKGVNNLYVGLSNAMYSGLPREAEIIGYTALIYGQKDRYEKRADFETAFASFVTGQVSESCVLATGTKKVYYQLVWGAPDDKMRKTLEEEGTLPYCEGIFEVEYRID